MPSRHGWEQTASSSVQGLDKREQAAARAEQQAAESQQSAEVVKDQLRGARLLAHLALLLGPLGSYWLLLPPLRLLMGPMPTVGPGRSPGGAWLLLVPIGSPWVLLTPPLGLLLLRATRGAEDLLEDPRGFQGSVWIQRNWIQEDPGGSRSQEIEDPPRGT